MDFKKSAILALVAFGLLLSGCTSPQGTQQPPAQQPQAPPAAPAPPSEDGSGHGQEQPPSPGDEEGEGLFGLSYEQLLALGQSLQCDIEVTDSGHTFTSRVYMSGSDKVRSEYSMPTSESSCTEMVYVLKDKDVYLGCSEGSMYPDGAEAGPFEGCDWMLFKHKEVVEDDSGLTTSTSYDVPEFYDVPSTKIDCKPWLYDASKFNTPGKVCDMEQIMEDLMAGYGDYY